MNADSGQPVGNGKAEKPSSTTPPQPAQEYDRRGVLLPARAKVGGIITPQ